MNSYKLNFKVRVKKAGRSWIEKKVVVYLVDGVLERSLSSPEVMNYRLTDRKSFFMSSITVEIEGKKYTESFQSLSPDLKLRPNIVQNESNRGFSISFGSGASTGLKGSEKAGLTDLGSKEKEAIKGVGGGVGGGGGGGGKVVPKVEQPNGAKKIPLLEIPVVDCAKLKEWFEKSREDRRIDKANNLKNIEAIKAYWKQYEGYMAYFIKSNSARLIKEGGENRLDSLKAKLKDAKNRSREDVKGFKDQLIFQNKKRDAAEKEAKRKCKFGKLGAPAPDIGFTGSCEYSSDYDSLDRKCGKRSAEFKSGGHEPLG